MFCKWLAVLVACIGVVAPAAAAASAHLEDKRWAAVHAAKMAGGYDDAKMPQIKENFRRMTGGATCRWNEFIPFWNKRYGTTRTVKPVKPTGRPPKLPAKLITTIATVWTQQMTGTGRNARHYLNMEEVRRQRRAPPAPCALASALC